MKRKEFLKKAGIAIAASPAIIQSCGSSSDEVTPKDDNTDEHCGLTDSATEGPFFLSNSAEAVNLNSLNLAGTAMKLIGTIYDNDSSTPIADAKIEIWHADNDGVYHPEGSGDVSDYPASQVTLRGFVISNSNGEYAVNSIKPGLYTGRRRHIHYKVTASGYDQLTTQSYWLDEKGSQREVNDGVDANTEECRYVDFKDNGNGGITGVFNIYMKKS